VPEKDIDVAVDPMNIIFARVMKVSTWIGLIIMILFGLLYLSGINPYLDILSAYKHWGKPVALFWREVKGVEVNGYGWYLSNLGMMDSLSMVGMSFLSLIPLVSVLFIIPRAKKIYIILLSILVLEFVFSIIRPIIL